MNQNIKSTIVKMTETELSETLSMINEEQRSRLKNKEKDDQIRLQNMSESDFIRGRVFGIKCNIRKAVVVKKDNKHLVTWRWVTSKSGEGTIDSVSDLMHWIAWIGEIELEHLEKTE